MLTMFFFYAIIYLLTGLCPPAKKEGHKMKFMRSIFFGFLTGAVSLLVLVGLAEWSKLTIYSSDPYHNGVQLFIVLLLSMIVAEKSKGAASIDEVIIDFIAGIITILIFTAVTDDTWFTKATGVPTILKGFCWPLGIDVLFAAFVSAPIKSKIS